MRQIRSPRRTLLLSCGFILVAPISVIVLVVFLRQATYGTDFREMAWGKGSSADKCLFEGEKAGSLLTGKIYFLHPRTGRAFWAVYEYDVVKRQLGSIFELPREYDDSDPVLVADMGGSGLATLCRKNGTIPTRFIYYRLIDGTEHAYGGFTEGIRSILLSDAHAYLVINQSCVVCLDVKTGKRTILRAEKIVGNKAARFFSMGSDQRGSGNLCIEAGIENSSQKPQPYRFDPMDGKFMLLHEQNTNYFTAFVDYKFNGDFRVYSGYAEANSGWPRNLPSSLARAQKNRSPKLIYESRISPALSSMPLSISPDGRFLLVLQNLGSASGGLLSEIKQEALIAVDLESGKSYPILMHRSHGYLGLFDPQWAR